MMVMKKMVQVYTGIYPDIQQVLCHHDDTALANTIIYRPADALRASAAYSWIVIFDQGAQTNTPHSSHPPQSDRYHISAPTAYCLHHTRRATPEWQAESRMKIITISKRIADVILDGRKAHLSDKNESVILQNQKLYAVIMEQQHHCHLRS